MKAMMFNRYGPPDQLELRDIPQPVPGDGEVLVKVHATSINDWDAGMVEGKPYFMRLFTGLRRPKVHIPGCDIAGTVEVVGTGVERFSAGDAVYGDVHASGFGGFAEYACVKEAALEPKPGRLTYEQAAALPHAATLAWQALFDIVKLKNERTLLINGAGGGVGPIALQLAKQHGLEVTGVDSADKLPALRAMGCDHVIDYRTQDFTRAGLRYDVILDVKTQRSPADFTRALNPNGTYVTVGGSMGRLMQALLLGAWIRRSTGKHIRILALKANRGLAEMAELFDSGAIVPVVDGPYPLADIPAAMNRFLAGGQVGRIVISVSAEKGVGSLFPCTA